MENLLENNILCNRSHLILMIMKFDVCQESFPLIAEYQASFNQVVELLISMAAVDAKQ